jgi:hypothetical protein
MAIEGVRGLGTISGPGEWIKIQRVGGKQVLESSPAIKKASGIRVFHRKAGSICIGFFSVHCAAPSREFYFLYHNQGASSTLWKREKILDNGLF